MKKKNNCPICQNAEAIEDKVYGILPCDKCQDEADRLETNSYLEFTSSNVKRERKEYAASMLQPFSNGHLSKEYLDTYGTSKIQVTQEDIRNAKEVYKGKIPRYHRLGDSKK